MDSGALPESLPVGRVTALGAHADDCEAVELGPGPLPALLLVEGLPLAELPRHTRLRLGGAVIELSGELARGGVADAQDPTTPVGARVIAGGLVRRGDPAVIESVAIPIGDVLDLHPFAPGEIAEVVAEYLVRAHAEGFGEVRLIHGRGRGIQRQTVRRALAASALVVAFADAPAERGGWGATVARLRRPS